MGFLRFLELIGIMAIIIIVTYQYIVPLIDGTPRWTWFKRTKREDVEDKLEELNEESDVQELQKQAVKLEKQVAKNAVDIDKLKGK